MKISKLIKLLNDYQNQYGDMEIQIAESGRDPSGITLERGEDWPADWNMPEEFLMLKD